jgi:hypothetical protein
VLKKVEKSYNKKGSENIEFAGKDNMENFNILMALGYFVFMSFIINSFADLDLKLFKLLKLFSLFTAIGFLIPIKLYRKKLTMSFYEYILFNILSVGPALLSLMLILNFAAKSEPYVETYKIVSKERESHQWVYKLEEQAYQNKKYLRTVENNKNYKQRGKDYLDIEFSDGLFGIRIIESKALH